MNSLAATREQVDLASSDKERLAALIDLASAPFEYDAAEATLVSDQAIALAGHLEDPSSAAWARHHRAWATAALGLLDEGRTSTWLSSRISSCARTDEESLIR